MTQEKDFVIKYNPSMKTKTGFLKTKTEKFYLGQDGLLTIVPIETKESILGGRIIANHIQDIPEQYRERILTNFEKIMRMYRLIVPSILQLTIFVWLRKRE